MAGTVFLHSAYPQGQARTGIKSRSISNNKIVTCKYFWPEIWILYTSMFGMRMYSIKENTFIIPDRFPVLEVDSSKAFSGLSITLGMQMCSKFSF